MTTSMESSGADAGDELAAAVGQSSGLFQCGSCKRQYKRLDHLSRHVRSHTQFRPHKCPVCNKAFSRTDLLKRHLASHNGRLAETAGSIRVSEQTGRVAQACQACSTNHLRCTDAKPCHRCTEKGVECVWAQDECMVDAAQDLPDETEKSSMEFQSQRRLKIKHRELSEPSLVGHHAQPMEPEPSSEFRASDQLLQFSQNTPTAQERQPIEPENDSPVSRQMSFDYANVSEETVLPSDFLVYRFPEGNFLPGQWPSAETSNFNYALPDIELDDIDLQFLNDYNNNAPFALTEGSQIGTPEATRNIGPGGPTHPAPMGAEAFRRHHWRFRPNAKDHAGSEEHNLSLPENSPAHTSPESYVSATKQITVSKLSVATRDSILTTVMRSCRPENLSRAFRSFPGVDLLDKLLQYYLMSPVARINSFIHAPTFDPNEKRPELLLSMAAAGAVLTSDPTLTKLGYAMQETVRPAVGTLWESNNTLIRNLELIQAFLIHLEVGIWSGHSRKIEITESFLQPPVTMLRRAGKFRASGYYSVEVTKASKGQELHALWQSWLEQETFKRTVFRILDHDTNSSMCLLVNPLMSYAEMTLPLPSSPTLWSQSNAEGWKLVYLALDQDQKCSLSEYIYSPADSNKLKHALDLELANRAFLSSAWNLSWECIQLRSLTNSPSTRLSVALLSSRQDEITKLLGNFRITMDDQSLANTQLTMRLEHIMLHLHLPLEDIQVFAGIEGADQASKVCPEVMKWTASEAARRSIWHAGQIVRQARLASKGSLQGPVAFMIYHASLALWAYALLCDRITNRSNPIAPDEVVWLDGEDSIALQRFLQLGSGTPSLNGVQSPGYPPKQISLKEPDDVIKAVACALVANYEGLPRPASVDGLIKLMQTLQKSPRASADEIL